MLDKTCQLAGSVLDLGDEQQVAEEVRQRLVVSRHKVGHRPHQPLAHALRDVADQAKVQVDQLSLPPSTPRLRSLWKAAGIGAQVVLCTQTAAGKRARITAMGQAPERSAS